MKFQIGLRFKTTKILEIYGLNQINSHQNSLSKYVYENVLNELSFQYFM